jgi:peptidoglycan hydrolase-like protein with peptidoglycan-binding domain
LTVFSSVKSSVVRRGRWMGRTSNTLAFLVSSLLCVSEAHAQDNSYIQILTIKGLAQTLDELDDLTLSLPDVNGFSLGGGWYAIAVGPYASEEAALFLRGLRQSGSVPADSYIEEAARYGRRIWEGGKPLVSLPAAKPVAPKVVKRPESREPVYGPKAVPDAAAPARIIVREKEIFDLEADKPSGIDAIGDAVAAESQDSSVDVLEKEADEGEGAQTSALPIEVRRQVQFALTWEGFFNSGVDGEFGERTIEAIRQWQAANGYEVTGVLLDDQREVLLKRHSSIVSVLAVTTVPQKETGIQIKLPLGAVEFDRYIGPFARYKPTGLVPGAQIFLLSQEGDSQDLKEIFDAVVAANIVPPGGVTAETENAYILIGRDENFDVYSHARIFSDQIKGFTVVWPRGDDQRRSRLMTEVLASFVPIPGVLSETMDVRAAASIVKEEIDGAALEGASQDSTE